MIDGTTIVALAVIFGMVAIITSGRPMRHRAEFTGPDAEVAHSRNARPHPQPDAGSRTIPIKDCLSVVEGLESIAHSGPSSVGVDTLFRSRGRIPEALLRGCGVPERLITYLPSLIDAMEPIQFYSCFISYGTRDQDFAERLHSRMRDKGLRVWFAPEDMQAGKKIHEQVDEAIRVYDKLLLVLSPHSIGSKWVRDEIRRARKAEVREGRRKLFPIRLMGCEELGRWESFYADLAEDLAAEIREYHIPDFTNWKDHDAFEAEFARLIKALEATEEPGRKGPPKEP